MATPLLMLVLMAMPLLMLVLMATPLLMLPLNQLMEVGVHLDHILHVAELVEVD